MDTALKQRLLGAAVLIALAIIFVPMFLGNAPKPEQGSTLNLDIPKPPEHDFQTRTLPVDGPAAATTAPAATEPGKLPMVDTTRAPAGNDAPQPGATPPVAASATPAATAPAQSASPAPASAPAPAPAGQNVPAATAGSAGASAPTGRFSVNLGVYADRVHADKLVASLKKRGYAAYDEPTDYQGKSATRVRVGPYPDRAAAEAARLRIKQFEPRVPSSVLEAAATEPVADAPANALPASRAGGWAVQLGAFKSEADANKLRDRLRVAGFAGYAEKTGSGDAALWRVRAGPFAERAGAEKARDGIDAKLKVKGMIVTQP